MALGDGIRRNIAHVEPAERTLLRDALIELNKRYYPGARTDTPVGGVSWWFKQDEIHQATHVHDGPEFIPWHRELINRMEELLRQINPKLSMHYWDWTQNPTAIPNANLGGGTTGNLNLFTTSFMGYGGSSSASIGEPWLAAGFYVPGANPHRDQASDNPFDPPQNVVRNVSGSPATAAQDANILAATDYAVFRNRLENVHDSMHGFVNMGGQHTSFRDPFVFLLHSNVDRLFARWQTDPLHTNRLNPNTVYGTESNLNVIVGSHTQNVNNLVEPWSTGDSEDQFGVNHKTRPWYAPENEGVSKTYKHLSVVSPPCYDTNHTNVPNVEVDNAGTPPVINFNDIPSGDTASRAAVFHIYGCAAATIRVKAGSGPATPFSILYPVSGSVTAAHELAPYTIARIWLGYTAGTANVAVPDGSVTFECVESSQEFTFVIKANSIIRPRVAVMLALDQSGSMAWAAGTSGSTRLEVLKDAAIKFMEIIPFSNGVGLIRFDTNAYPVNHATYPGLNVTRINNAGDRVAGIAAVTTHGAHGATSVGDGVKMARDILNALPAADYEQKALIVFTDGQENRPVSIASVSGSINNRTFAIGLGNETQVNTNALNLLTNSTGGYLKLTGLLSSSIDDYFRLPKYFLQILAGVTNNNIILDPNGYISDGQEIRIPFTVNEADLDATVILMVDVQVVGIAVETPNGDIIDPANAAGLGIDYSVGNTSKNYKFNLPVAFPTGNHTGEWFVILKINPGDLKQELSRLRDMDQELLHSVSTHGARYSVIVNTYSNLRMNASIHQNSLEPGANIGLRALLTEYGLPIENRASVNVEVIRPDSSMFIVGLPEIEPGIFDQSFVANVHGTYQCRFLADGTTIRGNEFTREQTLNAAVFQGGDTPTPEPTDPGNDGTIGKLFEKCCQKITRILIGILILILILIVLYVSR